MEGTSNSMNQGKGWVAPREEEELLESLRPKVQAVLAHPSVTSKRLLQQGDGLQRIRPAGRRFGRLI